MFKIFIICVLILSKLTAEQLLVNSGIKDFTQTPHINGSNTITLNTIPVRSAGGGCNASIDTIAVTSDRSSQLICQSGSWKSASSGGSSGTGMSGILAPLKGKQISCYISAGFFNATYYAQVDSSGNPYSRIVSNQYGDTGWVSGFTTSQSGTYCTLSWNSSTWPSLTGKANTSYFCYANWPMN